MAQYREGTVQVSNGSSTVNAVNPDAGNGKLATTEWLTEVSIGDLFYISGDEVAYTVVNVASDTSLSLSTLYQGNTVTPSGYPLTGAAYAVHRDFSTNYNMPVPSLGDIGMSIFIQMVIAIMDTEIKALDTRVTALEP